MHILRVEDVSNLSKQFKNTMTQNLRVKNVSTKRWVLNKQFKNDDAHSKESKMWVLSPSEKSRWPYKTNEKQSNMTQHDPTISTFFILDLLVDNVLL